VQAVQAVAEAARGAGRATRPAPRQRVARGLLTAPVMPTYKRFQCSSVLLAAVLACGDSSQGTTDGAGTTQAGTTQADTAAAPTSGTESSSGEDASSAGMTTYGDSTTDGGDSTTDGGDSTTDGGDSTTGAPFGCEPPADGTSGTTGDDETDGTTGEPAPFADWETYVAAECAALVDCGCVAPKGLGQDLAACVATRSGELAALAIQGYVWDGACAAQRIAAITAECAGDGEMPCEAERCELFHGDVGAGLACELVGGSTSWADASACTAELNCVGGLCVPGCGENLCDGQVCGVDEGCFYDDEDSGMCIPDVGLGHHCGHIYGPGCAAGLVCAGDDLWDGTCVQVGQACQPCAGACAAGLFCDDSTLLCWPRFPAGAPCALGEHCESMTCGPDGRCAPIPGEGEACPGHVCAEGLACGWPNFCWKIAGRGEPCPGIYHCEAGLVCGDTGVCEPSICHYL
jgi:hypothetical protein